MNTLSRVDYIRFICWLTGFPIVTTPSNVIMFGWWNWPLMAASCRNLTSSSSVALLFKVLMATSISFLLKVHFPFATLPNCPDPIFFTTLHNCDKSVLIIVFSKWIDYLSFTSILSVEFLGIFSLLVVHIFPQCWPLVPSKWDLQWNKYHM